MRSYTFFPIVLLFGGVGAACSTGSDKETPPVSAQKSAVLGDIGAAPHGLSPTFGAVPATGIDALTPVIGGNVFHDGPVEVARHAGENATSFFVRASAINPCAGCEPDRFEIAFPRNLGPAFGLGMLAPSESRVDIPLFPAGDGAQYLDMDFGSGHLRTAEEAKKLLDLTSVPDADVKEYQADIGRMRTPVVVFPREKLIVAYVQPVGKMLRVTETPASTSLVMKKQSKPEGGTAPLLVIKGQTLGAAYREYRAVLGALMEWHLGDPTGLGPSEEKTRFTFKRPSFPAYGVVWETYQELGTKAPIVGGATAEALQEAVQKLGSRGVKPSVVVNGSGFWTQTGYDSLPAYEFGGLYLRPTIDSLSPKEPVAYKDWIAAAKSNGIVPGVGMRHHASVVDAVGGPCTRADAGPSCKTGEDILRAALGPAEPYLAGTFLGARFVPGSTDNPRRVRMLDTSNDAVMTKYVSEVKAAYGQFTAIKEDEMVLASSGEPGAKFLPDGTVGRTYRHYESLAPEAVILGRNDWFGVGTDGSVGPGWIDAIPAGGETYRFAYAHRALLGGVMSGYPHPLLNEHFLNAPTGGTDGNDLAPSGTQCSLGHIKGEEVRITTCNDVASARKLVSLPDAQFVEKWRACCRLDEAKKADITLLRELALKMFSPIASNSRAFWHANPQVSNAMVYFLRLRTRLHQYAYDQAMRWHHTGEPHLMRPLVLDDQSEAVLSLYTPKASPFEARDEYMFGNAFLVRPIEAEGPRHATYLPAGRFQPFLRTLLPGETVQDGGRTVDYVLSPAAGLEDYPIWLKLGEPFVIGRDDAPESLEVKVAMGGATQSSEYRMYLRGTDRMVRIRVERIGRVYYARNMDDTGPFPRRTDVPMVDDGYGKNVLRADLTKLLEVTSQAR